MEPSRPFQTNQYLTGLFCSATQSATLRRKRTTDDAVLDLGKVTLCSEAGTKKLSTEWELAERYIIPQYSAAMVDDSSEVDSSSSEHSGIESPQFGRKRGRSDGEEEGAVFGVAVDQFENEQVKDRRVWSGDEDQAEEEEFDEVLHKMLTVTLDIKPVLDPVRVVDGGVIISQRSCAVHVNPSKSLYMTDAEFVHEVLSCPDFSHLIVHQAHNITDKGFKQVLLGRSHNGVSQMYKFSIARCPNVTDWTLHSLAASSPRLAEFSLFNCSGITNEGVVAVATRCNHLKVVNVDWCYGLSDASLFALREHCPELREFTAAKCSEFTINGFTALIQGCPQLEKLDLSDCQVTDDWLLALMAHGDTLTELKELDITGCSQVTPQCMQLLQQRFPRTTILPKSSSTSQALQYFQKVPMRRSLERD